MELAKDNNNVKVEDGSGEPPVKRQCLRYYDSEDQSRENRWDRILIVEGQKFHVIAAHLATHSDTFNNMFFKDFREKDQKEITLEGVNADDFQNFLETINGELCIKDSNIEGIMHLADYLGAPTAMKRCEHFLLNETQKSTQDKFHLAQQYSINSLIKKTVEGMKSIEELKTVLPEDYSTLDKNTMTILFKKAMQLPGQPPTYNGFAYQSVPRVQLPSPGLAASHQRLYGLLGNYQQQHYQQQQQPMNPQPSPARLGELIQIE